MELPSNKNIFYVWHTQPIVNAQGHITGIHGTFGLTACEFPAHYKQVAAVIGMDLNEVFVQTQHGPGGPWHHNPELMAVAGPVRSTSIGDVILGMDGVYVVAPRGFHKVADTVGMLPITIPELY